MDNHSNEDWRPQSPRLTSDWRPQSAGGNSMNSGADVEEGVSVDESHQSSTNLSNSSDLNLGQGMEILDSNGIWGAINGDERNQLDSIPQLQQRRQQFQHHHQQQQQLHNNHDAMIEVPVDSNMSLVSDITSSPQRPHTPRKTLEIDIDQYPAISPDSSKDSTEIPLVRKKTIRFSPSNKIHHFTPAPEEFVVNPDEFYRTNPTCGRTARLFLVVYALPFMYGASSNITTLYLLIELTTRYEINSWIAGVFIALAYVSRLVFASTNRIAPKSSVFFGSLVALVGFGLLFLSQDIDLLKLLHFDESYSLTLFIVGSILSNTNESMSAMQIFVRDQLFYNIKETGQKLKRHYQMAKIARVASFGGGGVLYQSYGIKGLAVLGAIMISVQIICLIIFFILDGFREMIDQSEGLWGEVKPPKRFSMNCSIRAALGRRRLLTSSMSKLNRTLARYYPPAVPDKILRTILPVCVFGRTIASIIIWNVSALIMEDDFGKDYIVIGAVFSGMMLCDIIVSTISLTGNWHTILTIKLPPPTDVYVLMVGVTLSLGLVATPNFIAFVIGLATFVCFNSALRTILSELQGSSSCGWESFQFQLIRRFWTAAALISIPILDNVNHRLPLVLAIWFAFLSTTVLVVVTQCHRRPDASASQEEENGDKKLKDSFYVSRNNNRPSRRPEKNLNYAERIMLSRLIKGKDV